MRQKVEGFSRDVRSAVERVEHLRKELEETVSLPIVTMESFQELQTMMVELEAAEEEIVQQYDEILSTRNALEYERARYRDLFDFAPDAYIVTDRGGKITEANRAACELLLIQPQFIAGKQLASYMKLVQIKVL